MQLVRRAKAYHGFDGGVSCLSVQRHKVMLKCNMFKNIKGCVEGLSSSDGWMAGPVLSNSGTKREFDSRLSAHERNRKAKKEINLQKDVQVSVHALEQVRDFDSKMGSQLKTIDEVEAYACLKKIMKELQAWLKVEPREVRIDKRRQGDAEDEQACSSIKRCRHKVRVMDLDQTGGVLDLQTQAEPLGGGSFHGVSWRDRDRESNDIVNHIGGVFRYFIVDVVDPGSTPDAARCGRELVEAYACLKKIMKELQAWLKVEPREVRIDKRRQGDAEDEQACSSIKRCRHKVRVMDLDQTGGVLDLQTQAEPLGGGSFHGVSWRDRDRESNDIVNHIGGVFRYFIVDVVDPGSTPDAARCGRELGEQFLSHEQR
ncbi:hypothetical protein F2Q69_00024775 [Brassica cretica]|uniref:Uncharacterized protein n=1 Tax=Brassica cretica TaxID=69181 RepID=A0A8S9Q6K5_BRACR|nr:hypothetical protein F2Q69_00024775 [Brassica cretica]